MKHIIALACCILALVTAKAAQVSYTVNVPNTATDWTNNIPIQRFNPSLGQLYKVVLNVGWTNHRHAEFWSLATNAVTYEVSYTCTTKLLWPDGSTVGDEVHTEWAAGTLGVSGGSYVADLTNNGYFSKSSCVDFAPNRVAWVGTGTLPFKATMTGLIELGPMDFNQIFPVLVTEGSASVTVTYFYTPGLTGTAFPCH